MQSSNFQTCNSDLFSALPQTSHTLLIKNYHLGSRVAVRPIKSIGYSRRKQFSIRGAILENFEQWAHLILEKKLKQLQSNATEADLDRTKHTRFSSNTKKVKQKGLRLLSIKLPCNKKSDLSTCWKSFQMRQLMMDLHIPNNENQEI